MPVIEFRDPALIALVALAVPLYLLARRAPGRVLFSSFELLPDGERGWRSRLAWVPDALLALSLVSLVLALAGPRIGERISRVQREGIAIMMVIDTSGSMAALDLLTPER